MVFAAGSGIVVLEDSAFEEEDVSGESEVGAEVEGAFHSTGWAVRHLELVLRAQLVQQATLQEPLLQRLVRPPE
jgi:hypothetical protein